MKKPTVRFMTSFKSFLIKLFVMGVLFGSMIHIGQSEGFDSMVVCAMSVVAVGAFVLAVSYYAMKKRVKMFLEDDRTSTITMDENKQNLRYLLYFV